MVTGSYGRAEIMLVSADAKTGGELSRALPRDRFSPVQVYGADEARRTMAEKPLDAVIIRPPLPDDLGLRLAEDLARFETAGIILLVGPEQYEQIAWRAQELGIIVLARPVDKMLMQQALGVLLAVRNRLKLLETKAESLQSRMDEIRLVSRAKLMLVEKKGMSEAEAHRYLEKTAMDRSIKRRAVAQEIIDKYSSRK